METLNKISEKIKSISDDSALQKLSEELIEWKNDESTVTELDSRIERFIGNIWIKSDAEHETTYEIWSKFRDEKIKGIGGMTMTERLYHFDLQDRYDSSNLEGRNVIYQKLLAEK
ncbi:MAG: hypothetical protein ABJG78_08475 [Cyclobacteriaceae bacterium]